MFEHKEESKNERLSDAELAEMRGMLAAATPGPWAFGGAGVATADGTEVIAATSFPNQFDLMEDILRTRRNGEFIAAAPESMGKLLDEVERLQAERAYLLEIRDGVRD